MRGPGYAKDPTHTVAVQKAVGEWVAERDGVELARSSAAIELREAGYPLVVYFPPEAVRLTLFSPSATRTYCPFKGCASYLSIDQEDVAWCYATPYDEVDAIRACIAFFASHVTVRST